MRHHLLLQETVASCWLKEPVSNLVDGVTNTGPLRNAWDGEEVARVGEGEEGGLVGSAEPGDPNLAGGPVLPMKLRVCRSGICLLSLCNSFYSLCCSLWPPKVVPSRPAAGLARGGTSNILPQ